MALDYNRLAAMAQRLIDANGRSITLRKFSRLPLDPDRAYLGSNPAGADFETLAVEGVLVDYTERELLADEGKRGAQRLLIAALDTDPSVIQTFDQAVIDGAVWKLLSITVYKPGAKVLCYDCQVRH